jgi:surface antigen
MRAFSVLLVVGIVASVGGVQGDAAARAARRDRSPSRAVPSSVEPHAVNEAVRCSCTSTSSCPQIGTLAIPGYKSEPLYCNQLNGSENPGVVSRKAWYFQCVELANRWLVEGVGAPLIPGNADQMCGNADSRSYDVYYRGTAHTPVPGDLLVWDGYKFGHVGVVASVSSSSIAFANQNYGQNGVQYPLLTAPRIAGFFGSPRKDGGLRAKCFIHPKKLASSAPSTPAVPAGPCDGVSSAHDGKYCGRSRQSGFGGGDASTLYTCSRGTTTSVRCRGTCTLEPAGRDDHCE